MPPLTNGVGPGQPHLDRQGCLKELRGTFSAQRSATRAALEHFASKLESIQKDQLEQQERLVAQLTVQEEAAVKKDGHEVGLAWPCAPEDSSPSPPCKPTGQACDGSSPTWQQHPNAVTEDPKAIEIPMPLVLTPGTDGVSPVLSSVVPAPTSPKQGKMTTSQTMKTAMEDAKRKATSANAEGELDGFQTALRGGREMIAMLKATETQQWKDSTSAERIVNGYGFKLLTTFAILLNAITIGIQTNQNLTLAFEYRDDESAERVWMWVEVCFTVFFTIELVLRACAERGSFVCGKNATWNLFDFCLVSTSTISLITEAFNAEDAAVNTPDLGFARMLRLIRFTRVLRLLRAVRFSESLRLILFSILASIGSLFWIWIVLFFVTYFWAVFFLTTVVEHYSDVQNREHHVPIEQVEEFFGSMDKAILSLFMSVTGGQDWAVVVEPLSEMSEWYTLFFTMYIFFMALGVMNIVIASFVDNAQQVSRNDRELATKAEIKQEKQYMTRIRSVFIEADKDNDGSLSWEEFEEYLKDDRVAAYLGSLGLDSSIARTLFVLLDVDDTNSVGIDEFVGGCLRLKGQARSIDVNMLLYNSEKMICKTTENMVDIGKRLAGLERHLGIASAPLLSRPGTTSPGPHPDSDGERSTRSQRSHRMSENRSGVARPLASMRTLNLNMDDKDDEQQSSSDRSRISSWNGRAGSKQQGRVDHFSHRDASAANNSDSDDHRMT